ncbi:hypothetical protein PHET_09323 [Paragonimus heterotremus]|uniref:Uncharacterized protein n=1 Tax=Paragonimus heterotremus TaxID=100268 RepID=A0A8J4SM02_9TREM|nr:hypothetical protein PHET_09323 [Paragonimus heterotremus]
MEEAQELGSSENETLKLRREYLKTQVALLEAQKDSLDKPNFIRGLVSGPSLNDINPNAKCEHDERYQKLTEELQQQTTALRTERERAFKCRLQYEASESARFILEEKFNLARTEFQADKEFYQKQLDKLDTNQLKEATQQTKSIETGLMKEKSEYLRENEAQRQLVLRLQEEEYVLSQMQSQFMIDREDLTESTKKQYKQRISELTEQHSLHIKSLEGQVKEFEHTVKELKSKLDHTKQIVGERKTQEVKHREISDEVCTKQKQTEQALKMEQLAISSERKTLWSLIIEMVSTVIETNNVECLRLAEVLRIPWIPISPPASLECIHNMDMNSLILEHSLAEIRQFSKDLVPQREEWTMLDQIPLFRKSKFSYVRSLTGYGIISTHHLRDKLD